MLPSFRLQFNISFLDSRQQASFQCRPTATQSTSPPWSNATALILTSLLFVIASLLILLVRERQRGWSLERLLANRSTECPTVTHNVVIEEPAASKARVKRTQDPEVSGLQDALLPEESQPAPASEQAQSATSSQAETVTGEEVPSLALDLRRFIGAQFNPSSGQETISRLSSTKRTCIEDATPQSEIPEEQLGISTAAVGAPGRSNSGVVGFSGVSISIDFAAPSTPSPVPARQEVEDNPLRGSWLRPHASDASRSSSGTHSSKWHLKHSSFINRKRIERQAEKKRKKEAKEKAEKEAKIETVTCLWDEPAFYTPRMEDGWALHSDNSKSTSDLSMDYEETQPEEVLRMPTRASTSPLSSKPSDFVKRHPAKNKILSLLRGGRLFRNPALLEQQKV